MESNVRNEYGPSLFTPFPGVLHFVYPNQRMLAKSFMRVQEFYESPLGDFKGRFFTRDEFKTAYAKSNEDRYKGEFTYYEDWNGFNVPGNVFDKFIELFKADFMEESLVEAVKRHKGQEPYYVIGTHEGSSAMQGLIEHELSHAFWHLDEIYRREAMLLVLTLPALFRIAGNKALTDLGYCEEVLDDEMAAYLSTSTMAEIADRLDTEAIPWQYVLKFQQHFANYLEEKEDEQE